MATRGCYATMMSNNDCCARLRYIRALLQKCVKGTEEREREREREREKKTKANKHATTTREGTQTQAGTREKAQKNRIKNK